MAYSIDDIYGGIVFIALGSLLYFSPVTVKGVAWATLVFSIICFLGGLVTSSSAELEKYGANVAEAENTKHPNKTLERLHTVLATAGRKSMANGVTVTIFSILVFILSILSLKDPFDYRILAGADVLFGIVLEILAFTTA